MEEKLGFDSGIWNTDSLVASGNTRVYEFNSIQFNFLSKIFNRIFVDKNNHRCKLAELFEFISFDKCYDLLFNGNLVEELESMKDQEIQEIINYIRLKYGI